MRDCARPPLANDRLVWDDQAQPTVRYHLPQPAPEGRLVLKLQPLDLIDKLAALIPPPRRDRHSYHGVVAPNAPRGEQITAAPDAEVHATEPPLEQTVTDKASPETTQCIESKPLNRPLSHYLWAALLARIFEILPLTCPRCGQEMPIIAFVTESNSVQHILSPARRTPPSSSRYPSS